MEFDPGPPETKRWFISTKPRPQARVRLFCFSFVGGAAGWFDDWSDRLSSQVEVVAVVSERGAEDFSSLIKALTDAIRAGLDLPFAFFGHGLGALVAFELARALRAGGGPIPSCLFVTGQCAPCATGDRPTCTRSAAEAADGPLLATYRYRQAAPLECPIVAYGSLADAELGVERLDGWRDETAGPLVLHFFPEKPPCLRQSQLLFDEMARALSPWRAKSPSDPVGRPPNSFPALSPQQVHLWRIRLDRPPAAHAVLAECLSPEEQRRAERFVRDQDRQRFIVSHAALRMILGQYLGLPPGRVEMEVAAGGKPSLAPSPGLLPLRFNLSHSEERALVGITLDQRIGVDVEHWRAVVDAENIVKRYFSVGERTRWQTLAEDERRDAFFRGWTRKEAYLKARGVGLSAGLDQFDVSLVPGQPTRLVEGGETNHTATPWQVYDVSPGRGYSAAFAVEGEIETASLFDWPW